MAETGSERWRKGVRLFERLQEARSQERNTSSLVALWALAQRAIANAPVLDSEIAERIDALEDNLNEFGYDPFGFSPSFVKKVMPAVAWIYRHYFRVEAYGVDDLPEGPVLLIANHSGQIPIDGGMIVTACLLDKTKPRMVRSMIERWVPSLPMVSWVFARAGQMLGSRDNFRRLVQQGSAILVFPEGVIGINKTYDKAYQLQRFGYGFMRLALENGLPIVPVAVIGAEEQAPAFFNAKGIARVMGAPAFPITPTFPLLGPLGMLPYPVKYRIYFGQAMQFEGRPDDEDKVIGQKVDQVKESLQALINKGLSERKSIFF